ncbi:MAG TPA: MFS transporter [Accumulibacter sp.]|nr:MFS transporter [Accumulibacter sp.]HMW18568.1 MFS transporter [Accumulibacter sp.]HMX22185.1 MFS transporter [Accumulibacter sp.]HNC17723.1 MFS transporter [Accumulibacter sp.]HND80224.1 MFS transporter [Accumulibacter sp.]
MIPSRPHPPMTLAWTVWGLGALLYLIGFFQRVAPAVMTDRLMDEFSIGATELGNLSAFYFYSYVAMQIPTGILADRWGPRRLLSSGAAVAAIGSAFFAFSPTLWWANAGRLLIGASVAVAFVSMLKLATRWFAPRQFALVSGLALFCGVVGGVIAGVPLRLAIESWGWRPVIGVSSIVCAGLSLAIWLGVRDDPAERGYRSHAPVLATTARSASIGRDICEVLSYRNIWILLITPIGIAGAVLTFAGLWGVPYLRQVHGLATHHAAAITSLLLVAWAIGGPLLGSLSERLGRRRPLYVATTLAALLGWLLIIYLPLPVWLLTLVLLITGLMSGNLIIGFAFAKESVPARLMGTASGICNMGPLLGGMLLQPAVGWLLDRHWQGLSEGAVRIYDLSAYRAGFGLMAACITLSLCLIPFARETFGQETV